MSRSRTVSIALAFLLLANILACGAGDVTMQDMAGRLVAVSVSPSNSVIANRSSQQFIATAIYSNHVTKDVTATATWQTSNASIATISNTATSKGMVTSTSAGTITVIATYEGVSGSTNMTVTAATLVSIAVTPVQRSIPRGTNQQFTATGTYSDNTTQNLTASVTWSSSNPSIAAVSDTAGSKGIAAATTAGTVTITASSGTVAGTASLTVTPATLVSLAITPVNPSIARGMTRQFTATGTYSDNTTQNLTAAVTWSSSNTTIATVSNTAGIRGLTSGLATGTATITAVLGSLSASTTLRVTPATLSSIVVMPVNPSIARGTTRQFNATGSYSDNTTQTLTDTVAWYSSNTNVATISNAAASKGSASALATGSTVITAASGSVSGTTTLTVTPATLVSIAVTPLNPSIARGTIQQFTATGTYSDNTTQNLTASVTWSSSSAAVATISNAAGSNGSASGFVAGTTNITAVSGTISGTTSLTVTAATLVSISIAPINPSIAQGTSSQFTATGTFSDASTQDLTAATTWSSSDPAVASISNAAGTMGLATAISVGSVTITALVGNVSATASLTVTPSVSGNVTLSWEIPSTNTDGSPLTDIGGYKIYYGHSPGSYSASIDAGNVNTYYVNNLTAGTYYFTVTVYNLAGSESSYSNEVSKIIP